MSCCTVYTRFCTHNATKLRLIASESAKNRKINITLLMMHLFIGGDFHDQLVLRSVTREREKKRGDNNLVRVNVNESEVG